MGAPKPLDTGVMRSLPATTHVERCQAAARIRRFAPAGQLAEVLDMVGLSDAPATLADARRLDTTDGAK